MFCVIFEVQPDPPHFDAYLDAAMRLKPELERIEGFLSVERFRSRAREGWVLSLSFWRDEAALTRWRTHPLHHRMQERGRAEIFRDYRLRVGQVIRDAAAGRPAEVPTRRSAWRDPPLPDALTGVLEAAAEAMAQAPARAGQELFDSLYAPGRSVLLAPCADEAAAMAWEPLLLASPAFPPGWRFRLAEIERDYGMFARDQAPQYFPPRA